jgi:hypothetical protein
MTLGTIWVRNDRTVQGTVPRTVQSSVYMTVYRTAVSTTVWAVYLADQWSVNQVVSLSADWYELWSVHAAAYWTDQ